MKLLVAVALAVCLAGAFAATQSERDAFRSYMRDFGKSYEIDEFDTRFYNFRQSLHRIAKKNAARTHPDEVVYGLTKFSDLSVKEFKGMFLNSANANHAIRENVPETPAEYRWVGAMPDNFDWKHKGAVTPVKDQGQCGSCWAFSATEEIESMWFMAGNNLTHLAPQQIVDCDNTDAGCDGGDTPTAYEYVMHAGGMMPEKDYKYTARDGTCKFHKNEVVAQIKGYSYATKSRNETQMMDVLYKSGPLSICVEADTWQDYNSGVITKHCGRELDHCVQITGFGTGQGSNSMKWWEVRNSWGTDWGEQGYLRVEVGKDLCGIADEVTLVHA